MYPEVKEKIEEIIVFQSGVKINMLGLDVTEKALLHRENILKMRDSGKTGNMLYALFENYRGGSMDAGLMLHDACTITFLMKPELFQTEEKYVEVVSAVILPKYLKQVNWMKKWLLQKLQQPQNMEQYKIKHRQRLLLHFADMIFSM